MQRGYHIELTVNKLQLENGTVNPIAKSIKASLN